MLYDPSKSYIAEVRFKQKEASLSVDSCEKNYKQK